MKLLHNNYVLALLGLAMIVGLILIYGLVNRNVSPKVTEVVYAPVTKPVLVNSNRPGVLIPAVRTSHFLAKTVASCQSTGTGCQVVDLQLMNQERAAIGVSPLTADSVQRLGSGACVGSRGHSKAMASVNQIFHQDVRFPTQSFPSNICGYYSTAGENVAETYGTKYQALVQAHGLYMAEPHDATTCRTTVNHACNILNPKFHTIGFWISKGSNGYYFSTEDFKG